MNKIQDFPQMFRPASDRFSGEDRSTSQKATTSELLPKSEEQVSLGSPLKVALQSLSSAVMRNLPFAAEQPTEPEIEKSGFDFELVANNITSFIETAVNKARDRGESDEFIENMLQQARQGVEQGFGEARDELKELGMMNEDIDQGIDQSFELVYERLNNFEKQLFESNDRFTPNSQVEVSTYSSRSVGEFGWSRRGFSGWSVCQLSGRK